MNITVYDYAEHIGEALAWTSPSKGGSPIRTKKGTVQGPPPVGGQLLYTHLKQAAMFGGDSNSRWCAAEQLLQHVFPSVYGLSMLRMWADMSLEHCLCSRNLLFVRQRAASPQSQPDEVKQRCVALTGRTGCGQEWEHTIPRTTSGRLSAAVTLQKSSAAAQVWQDRTGCGIEVEHTLLMWNTATGGYPLSIHKPSTLLRRLTGRTGCDIEVEHTPRVRRQQAPTCCHSMNSELGCAGLTGHIGCGTR